MRHSLDLAADVSHLDADADEENEFLRETFILRRADLTQEQWSTFLGSVKPLGKPVGGGEDLSESTSLLSRKSGSSLTRTSGTFNDGPVMSRKSSTFDLESGDAKEQQTRYVTPMHHTPLTRLQCVMLG